MYYALVDIIAIFVIFVINFNIIFKLFKPRNKKANILYRLFLLTLFLYYVTDALWGIFYDNHLATAITIDTNFYFIVMVASVLAWTLFVSAYLDENNKFDIVLKIVGLVVFVSGVTMVIVNFFTPILFVVDENAKYHQFKARNALLGLQIILYLISAVYAFIIALRNKGEKKTKDISVAAVGIAMSTAIYIQFYLPEYPVYAVGCLVGNCLCYTFIVRWETDGFIKEIRERKKHEEMQEKELGSVTALAYSDPLTGVKNKHAYVEKEQEIDILIRDGKMDKFSIIVFDLNDLKVINDTRGHDIGDKYIIKTCDMINDFFQDDDVYRFGGDEFVLILQGESYAKRYKILERFNAKVEANVGTDNPIIATGISDYVVGKDNTLRAVFTRADEKMYMRKRSLKEMYNG